MSAWSQAGADLVTAVEGLNTALTALATARRNRGQSSLQGGALSDNIKGFLRDTPGGGTAIADHAHQLGLTPR